MAFSSFQQLVNNRFKFGMFLLYKLPAAWIAGVRPVQFDANSCKVSLPYKWLNQNPFNSIYFACLAMAAEMSTGLLAMGHVYQSKPAVSMLVVGLRAEFGKKATEKITFTCNDGAAIEAAITTAKKTNTSTTIEAISTGKNKAGETVAVFYITWSFKAKQNGVSTT